MRKWPTSTVQKVLWCSQFCCSSPPNMKSFGLGLAAQEENVSRLKEEAECILTRWGLERRETIQLVFKLFQLKTALCWSKKLKTMSERNQRKENTEGYRADKRTGKDKLNTIYEVWVLEDTNKSQMGENGGKWQPSHWKRSRNFGWVYSFSFALLIVQTTFVRDGFLSLFKEDGYEEWIVCL